MVSLDRFRRHSRERMLNYFLNKCPAEYQRHLKEAALTNHVVMFVLPDMEKWMVKFIDELIGRHIDFKSLDQREFVKGRKIAPIAVPLPAASGEQIREIGAKIGMIQ